MSKPVAVHPTHEELAAFGLGKLTRSQSETIAYHLESCEQCRTALDAVPADSFVDAVQAARPDKGGATTPGPEGTAPSQPAVSALVPPHRSSQTGSPIPPSKTPCPDSD